MNNLKIPNFLIFCIIAFAFISCSQFQLAKEEQQQIKLESKNSLKLMTEEEVIAGFKGLRTQLANKSLFDEKISPEAKERFANLIPENAFFDGKSKLKSQLSFKSTQKAKGSADISEFDSPLESQWNGTCTAHAMRNVLDNKGRTLTSTRHIWSKYRVYSCESAVKALLNKSCVTNNSAWPHSNINPKSGYLDIKNCNTYLKSAPYIDSDLNQMKLSLDAGNPVYLGISVTKSMLNCDKVLNPDSSGTGGGHALAIVGYKDSPSIAGGGYFKIKNSWGDQCGDYGYQYIPYNYCTRNDLYCIMWTINQVDTKANNVPIPDIEPVCLRWKRVWYAPWKFKCAKWKNDTSNMGK